MRMTEPRRPATTVPTPAAGPSAPVLGDVADRYLDALLDWRRDDAIAAVLGAAEAGVDVRDLYLSVLAPAQRRVGELWAQGRIAVGVEHWCTGVTQLVLARLSPWVFAGERSDRVAVAACVEGDLHELPVRMVADFLELDGWRTRFLGASTPADAVVDVVADAGADLLLVGATLVSQLDGVAVLVERLHADDRTAAVPVLVGGAAFAADPSAVVRVGADAHARTAADVPAAARRLVADR